MSSVGAQVKGVKFAGPSVFAVVCLLLAPGAMAQRQMEKLGRGVVVIRPSSNQAYISWRLLASDPADVGFNVYRSAGGAAPLRLNSQWVTNTADFLDTTANFTLSNAWFVRAVVGGVEQEAGAVSGLRANPPVRQYVPVPLSPVAGGAFPPYDVKFCWVGDLDGDGEYDFVVDRISTTGGVNEYLQAYKRDGTLLWQMDMGYNSTNQYSIEPGASAISIGDKDNVTVYDLDGDGRAEVLVRTARGVVLPGGSVITGPDDTTQYLSVLDGLTGTERARATIPNPYFADGPLNSHFGILYCDGVHPSLVIDGENRLGSGPFQRLVVAYDFNGSQVTQRWYRPVPANVNEARGQQIRIADVNHDGKDDLIEIGSAYDGATGQPSYDTELGHGDRYHITDLDPDRPGLETYAIQQDNPTLLATALLDARNGQFIKKWYSSGVVDVGRGDALDMDPRYKGVEVFSTQLGVFDCRGVQIPGATAPWPALGIWWDADLRREIFGAADGNGYSPVISKWNYLTSGTERMYSVYAEGVHTAYGGRPAFFGDILGDWREEFVAVANDYSELRIYTTKIAATNRLYCLMQNPAYRLQCTCKGYYQASYPDYYLGEQMAPPAPPPAVGAKLVWRGGGANLWDTSTANWFTNGVWISNTIPASFSSGDSVLFDLTGSNQAMVALTGTLTPGDVTVYAPKDYVLGGSGSLTGPMKLTKAGAGELTLSGTNKFTGTTTVWEGALVVNGSLSSSPVTVRGGVWLDGAISGTGVVGGAVTVYRGGSVAPGNGSNGPGTLTLAGGLSEIDGAYNRFKLSDDPSGTTRTNDRVSVLGNLTLTGTNVIAISLLNSNLAPGLYPLITYSGSFFGSVAALTVQGVPGIPVAVTNPPGQIALLVKIVRAPAAIRWTGGNAGNAWDLLQTTNWLNGAARDQFAPYDAVRFDDAGATNATVNLVGDLNASSVVVDSASNYTFSGSGGIIGACSLLKSNAGTFIITALNNSYSGRTVTAGGTVVVPELDAVGFPSPLGNPGANPTNLVLTGNSTLRLTGEAYTDRGLTVGAGTNSLEVLNSGDQLTIAGTIVGMGALQKLGPGTLALTTSNSYSGGTLIRNGAIALGSATGNVYGLGTGTVTLDHGTLSMMNIQASETAAWNLAVPAGSTGRLDVDGRCTLTGTLTGDGALTIFTPYVRSDFKGNWSAFSGQISVITDADGGNFRCLNSAGYPLARISLAAGVSWQNRVGGTPTIPVGELAGAAGSWISAPGGNDGVPVTWRVGGLHTTATFAGTIANAVGLIKEGQGTWILTGTNTYSGTTTVNSGTILINGNQTAATNTVTVAVGGTLGGAGVIGGPVTVSGSLAPGNGGAGRLTCLQSLTLAAMSTNVFELTRSPRTNDVVNAAGTLTLGGTLIVTNIGPALVAGDNWNLLEFTNSSGAFNRLVLPPLSYGLAWDTSQLYTTGLLRVGTAPRFDSVTALGTSLVFSGSGGGANSVFYLLAATNPGMPVMNWTRVATNSFDASGNFRFTNVVAFPTPQQYFRLQIP